MNIGIIICSRRGSSRVPNKPFLKVDEKPIICHLVDRAALSGIPVYVAVPEGEHSAYNQVLECQRRKYGIRVFEGCPDDPLKRKLDCARKFNLDVIIRVCHDKIFIDHRQIREFVDKLKEQDLDYIYSTNFIDGMSFEIFTFDVLVRAHNLFRDVEHISFAVDAVAKRKLNYKTFPFSKSWFKRKYNNQKIRLLIDYKEDLQYIRRLFEGLNYEATIEDAARSDVARTNLLPKVTVYTCCFNDSKYLQECIESVLAQEIDNYEYLLVDDGSTDGRVGEIMEYYSSRYGHIKHITNKDNLGLASSSNIALGRALGKYIIRLDSDDYFLQKDVITRMMQQILKFECDVIYPDNIKDDDIQKGYENHHVGGALFRARSLRYLRFTDNLRHYEGRDLYQRIMKKRLKVCYFNSPAFYYRQRSDSLSRRNETHREVIARKIDSGLMGDMLLTANTKA